VDNQICTKCLIDKPIIDFYKREDSRFGCFRICKICTSKRQKIQRQRDAKKIAAYNHTHMVERRKNDINYHIKCNLRRRIRYALKDGLKTECSLKLLGCTTQELKNHLELQFKEGMTFKNYGIWHMDHIKPCAAFDLSIPDQQRECFHFSNLQPLWSEDNLKKGSKLS